MNMDSMTLRQLLNPELVVPVVMAIAGAIIAVTAVIAVQWRKVRQADFDASLKNDMLNRGMSADEIERVVKASSRSTHGHHP